MQGFVSGLGLGGIYAFLGVYLCTSYRLLGVVNLGICAMAGFGATVTAALTDGGWPVLLACLAGLAVVALACVVAGAVLVRLFPGASVSTQSAVTIAFLLTSLGAAQVVFGVSARSFPVLVQGQAFTVAGVSVPAIVLVCVGAAVALALAVPALMTRTRLGTRLVAISERPITSELLGLRTAPVVVTVWVAGGVLVTFLILLVAPSIENDSASLAMLIVPGCAAALVGAFRKLGWALAGGLVLGGVQGDMALSSSWSTWSSAVPFVLIALLLVWSQRQEVWDAAR